MRIACLALGFAVACGGGSAGKPDTPPSDGFDRNALLGHLANQVLLPLQTRFAGAAAQLPPAIAAYCDALDRGDAEPPLAAARASWAAALDAWEAVDALLVGPAAMDNRALRDRIYG